jgi:hypothetical protein
MQNLLNKKDEARSVIVIAQKSQKQYVNVKRIDKQFKVKDLILLKFNRFEVEYKSSAEYQYKLDSLLSFLHIVQKISLLVYKVALSLDSKIHDVVSIVYLKKFKSNNKTLRSLSVIQEDVSK